MFFKNSPLDDGKFAVSLSHFCIATCFHKLKARAYVPVYGFVSTL